MIKWGKKSYTNVHVFRKDVNYLYFIIKINNTIVLTPGHIKSYILQTLKGLEYLHCHWILHRESTITLPS
jgi:serine/threonine protein kinase